jgi:hypothetical protein
MLTPGLSFSLCRIIGGQEDPNYPPTCSDNANGARQLRACVERCCSKVFGMSSGSSSPLFIVQQFFPRDFHHINACKLCVELTLEITLTDKATGQDLNKWTVELNADAGSRTSSGAHRPPHYGYTVQGAVHQGARQSKFSGHVYLPNNPAAVRPLLVDDSQLQCMYFCNNEVKVGGERSKGTQLFQYVGMHKTLPY